MYYGEIFADPVNVDRVYVLDVDLPGVRRRRQDAARRSGDAQQARRQPRHLDRPDEHRTTTSSAATAACTRATTAARNWTLLREPADHAVLRRRRRQRGAVLQRLRRHAGQLHARRPGADAHREHGILNAGLVRDAGRRRLRLARRSRGPEHRLRRAAARRPRPLRQADRRARRHPAAGGARASAPLRWNWDSPLIIRPHTHTRLYFARATRSSAATTAATPGRPSSPDLTRQLDRNKLPVMGKVWGPDAVAKNTSTSLYGNIVALAESRRRRKGCSTSAPTTA